MADSFDYNTAFSRNIGWVTTQEQAVLQTRRVAIAGLGGVGGSHLLTLSRLGIGAFHIADFDRFELANFNRQAGASVSSLGHSKTEVLAGLARDINPDLDLKLFADGIDVDNVADFLAGVDVYVDGLDFFAVAARRTVFAACAQLGIPAITAAPLGMGVALLNFLPGRMSFEQYFRLDGHSDQEQLLRFLLGLSPAMLQGRYLVDPSAVDIANHRGPSTAIACELCAGLAAAEALKILLRRGKVASAPWGLHFDAYRNRMVRTWRPGGNRNPVQKLGLAVARRRFGSPAARSEASTSADTAPVRPVIDQILDLARWAPSGDNSQPWRFAVPGDRQIVIHGHDTREHCVYDLRGRASQLALGALIETLAVAASGHGLDARTVRRQNLPETTPTFDVSLTPADAPAADPLLPFVQLRSTQRRPLAARRLTARERRELEQSVGNEHEVIWVAGWRDKLRLARLLFDNGGLRLRLPEAYEVHRTVIDWETDESQDRIPARAVGLDPLTLHLMRWAMTSWARVSFLNRYLGGTLLPRLQLDFLPALACGAHFVLLARRPPESADDYVAAGRAVQRFWLTASRLGLFIQPEQTPLIFHSYIAQGVEFTHNERCRRLAERLAGDLDQMFSSEATARAMFMGRIGAGAAPKARSTRLPLERLRASPPAAPPAAGRSEAVS